MDKVRECVINIGPTTMLLHNEINSLNDDISSTSLQLTHYNLKVSDKDLAELKKSFMEAYDDNKDGKIEIREVSEANR